MILEVPVLSQFKENFHFAGSMLSRTESLAPQHLSYQSKFNTFCLANPGIHTGSLTLVS